MLIRAGMFGVLFLVALIGSYFLLRLPEITIANVSVEGTVTTNSEEIKSIAAATLRGEYGFVIPKQNVLFAPLHAVEVSILQNIPTIKRATVERANLTSVSIVVTERTPSALWCPEKDSESSACYFMDEEGFVYAPSTNANELVSYQGSIQGGPIGAVFLSGAYSKLSAFVSETAATLGRSPRSVSIDEHGDASLFFVGGGELRFTLQEDSAGTLDNIASVFATQKLKGKDDFEYADFRFGNKVYVKFKE